MGVALVVKAALKLVYWVVVIALGLCVFRVLVHDVQYKHMVREVNV